MNFAQDEDEDQAALNAALSFLDEFEPLVAARDEGYIDVLGIAQLDADYGGIDLAALGLARESVEGKAQAPSTAAIVPINASKAAITKYPRSKTGKFNPNRARDEQRKELVYLRNKVAEMETQLEELKQADSENCSFSSSAAAKSVARLLADKPTVAMLTRGGRIRASSRPQFVWEEIASRQYAERHKAELENVKLKLMLKGQIKVAKSLESVLKKRSTTQMLELYRKSTMPLSKRSNHSGAEEEDAEIFEMLLADLDRSLEEVDSIFEANGLNKTEETFQDAIVRSNEENGIYLEVFANKTMPFDIHATSNAVWLHFSSHQEERIPSRTYYERQPKKMKTTEDTIVESYGIKLQAKRTNAHFRTRHTTRRFVEEDRVLIAWRMVYDPVEFSSQPTSGIRFYEKGYILIKRPTTRSPDFSLMQTCFIMTPERYGPNPWNDNIVGRLSNFLVDTTARNIYFSHQMIENFLMDEALKLQL